MFRRAFATFAFLALVSSAGLLAQSKREPKRVGLDEQATLQNLVEEAMAGERSTGHAWLKWRAHFLRGSDGKTYVPFTLKIDEAPGAFRAAAMYVRVAPRGDEGRAGRRAEGVQNALGVATGELPVNSPERRQGAGAPTASDASLMLRSLTAKPPTKYAFEAAYGVEPSTEGRNTFLRRSMAVSPGEYDLYIALPERDQKGTKKWAVLKQPITVPDLSLRGLRLSSVIVADRVEPLDKPLSAVEQTLRPYAMGAAELVPTDDETLRRDETLNVAFVIYDAAVDATGKPDVRIEYRLFHLTFPEDRLLGSTPPQSLDASTLPENFDLRTGQQLAAMQSLPLSAYQAGSYRLVILVTDNRNGSTASEELRFTIAP